MKVKVIDLIIAVLLVLLLAADSWPQTISATYIGVDLDKVGEAAPKPDGRADNHIKVSNVTKPVIGAKITDETTGIWQHPFNGMNWEIAIEQAAGVVDLWFATFRTSRSYGIVLTYADGTTDVLSTLVTSVSSLLGQVAVLDTQTLCSSSYVNSDSSITASYWADVGPCVSMANTPILKLTVASGVTICVQRQAVGVSSFDIWTSKILPCTHP